MVWPNPSRRRQSAPLRQGQVMAKVMPGFWMLFTDWLHTYNHHRGHTALGGKSPADLVPNLRGQNT